MKISVNDNIGMKLKIHVWVLCLLNIYDSTDIVTTEHYLIINVRSIKNKKCNTVKHQLSLLIGNLQCTDIGKHS